jgi:hypothetical protein
MANFIRCGPEKVASLASYKWAVNKASITTESLARHLGNWKSYPKNRRVETDKCNQEDDDDDSMETNSQGTAWVEKQRSKKEKKTKDLIETAQDLVANLINKGANKDPDALENMWSYKATSLASSISKTEATTTISEELKEVTKLSEKNARDVIAHNLNQLRHATIRVDKTMAMNIRSCQVFRLDPENTGHISIFHCYPRQPFELQDMMSGEEIETKIKVKAITAKAVMGLFEQKLGIAEAAHIFSRQMYNFWQLNGFIFGDQSWIAIKIGEIYELLRKREERLESLAARDKDYILQLAAIINNRYHHFLSSCVEAKGDISKVRWDHVEGISEYVDELILSRDKPRFVLTSTFRAIAEQTESELKRKRMAENLYLEPAEDGNMEKNRFKRFKKGNELIGAK